MINFLPFTKKNWIQYTTNLINYIWSIGKNVIIDLPLERSYKIENNLFTK